VYAWQARITKFKCQYCKKKKKKKESEKLLVSAWQILPLISVKQVYFIISFHFCSAGNEQKALHMTGKHSTTKPHPQPQKAILRKKR
jgi:hypothetical protein